MMRIIGTEKFTVFFCRTSLLSFLANPVYDKMTISRAAQIQKHPSLISTRKSVRISLSKAKPISTPIKALNSDETTITVCSDRCDKNQILSTFFSL